MVIRIEPEVHATLEKALKSKTEVAQIARYLMTPVALATYTLAAWRLGADMNWTGEFFVSKGLFSHWQVWLGLAIATQAGGAYLDRIIQHERETLPDEVAVS